MIIAFDIETVPDTEGGRLLYDLEGLGTEEASKAMLAARRAKIPEAAMLPLHQQKVVAVSAAVRWDQNNFIVKSLGEPESSERHLVSEFFRALQKRPTLVSWNGNGFDLPVLQYRALIHSVPCTPFWDTGEFDREFRFNNYQSRYHKRHVDLMDILARFQGRANASLDEIAKLIGLPGKVGVGGAGVFDAYLNGEIQQIRDYCDIDALNTYLIYLRYELIRGALSEAQFDFEIKLVHSWLAESETPRFVNFASDWQPGAD